MAKSAATARELIEALGGPKAVAGLLEKQVGRTITPQAVSAWYSKRQPWGPARKRRRVPYEYRPFLAMLATKRKLNVSQRFLKDFLRPQFNG
jgi:hypothetical protein